MFDLILKNPAEFFDGRQNCYDIVQTVFTAFSITENYAKVERVIFEMPRKANVVRYYHQQLREKKT